MNILFRQAGLGILLSVGALSSTSQAQTKVAAPKVAAPVKRASKPVVQPDAIRDDLPITPLPQVPVEFEFVGTQKDLLGLVQSLARGAAAKDKSATPEATTPTVTSPTATTPVASNVEATKDEKVKFSLSLSDDEMLQMLQDIHFLRAQSFNFVKLEHQQGRVRAREADLKVANGSMSAESYLKLMKEPFPQHLDVQDFYGREFRAQKGRRQFFLSGGDTDGTGRDDTTVSIWLFDAPRSWALVTQGPSRAIVVRADSFPPLEVAGRLIREVLKD